MKCPFNVLLSGYLTLQEKEFLADNLDYRIIWIELDFK